MSSPLKLSHESQSNFGEHSVSSTMANASLPKATTEQAMNEHSIQENPSLLERLGDILEVVMPFLSVKNLLNCKRISSKIWLLFASRITTLNLSYSKITDIGLQTLRTCTGLTNLDLSCCHELTNNSLLVLNNLTILRRLDLAVFNNSIFSQEKIDLPTSLGSLTTLKDLNLRSCTITHVEFLSKFTVLERLDLASSSINDIGLFTLDLLTNLKYLCLTDCKITDAGLPRLNNLTALRSLKLAYCEHITDAGLSTLSNLVALRSLNLALCEGICGVGLSAFTGSTALESLILSACTNVNNAGLQALSNLKALKELWLCKCPQITDNDIPALRQLQTLQYLNLKGCKITTTGLMTLNSLKDLKKLGVEFSDFQNEDLDLSTLKALQATFPILGIQLTILGENFLYTITEKLTLPEIHFDP